MKNVRKFLFSFALLLLSINSVYCLCDKEETGGGYLKLSDYVTIVVAVPATHADSMREAMGRAGAGKIGNYSHCSWSIKGIGRFMPTAGSAPYLGEEGVLEEVIEERIETVCSVAILEHVIEEMKKAHPYEEAVIDIFPIYEIGRKKATTKNEIGNAADAIHRKDIELGFNSLLSPIPSIHLIR